MREVIFRGKDSTNKWVFGGYFRAITQDGYKHFIIDEHAVSVEVVPESVGQYIGQEDKVDRKIFEGHIMRGKFATGLGGSSTRYKPLNFSVSFNSCSSSFHMDIPKNLGRYRFFPNLENCEIIGDIHTTPELIA